MKEKRIESLKEIMDKIKEMQESYIAGTSAWSLLQAASGPIIVLHHLEGENLFSDEVLGAKGE